MADYRLQGLRVASSTRPGWQVPPSMTLFREYPGFLRHIHSFDTVEPHFRLQPWHGILPVEILLP